jgi:hypothetical protein
MLKIPSEYFIFLKPFRYYLPVKYIPVSLKVIRSFILIIEVIGMLPYIAG